MLAEFVSKIADLTDARRRPTTLDLPGDRLLVTHGDGRSETLEVPPPRRAYELSELSSFVIALADDHKSPAVFLDGVLGGPVEVVGFFDLDDRRDRITYTIPPSVALSALLYLGKPSKQAAVVAACRDQLFSAIEPGLLPKLRTLDFKRRNDGSSSIDHGRESLGRSVELSVQSKHGEIPELTTLTLPWFAEDTFAGFTPQIDVAFEMDAVNETIRFCPRGDQLQLAHRQALQYVATIIRTAVHDAIDDHQTPILIGRPTEASE